MEWFSLVVYHFPRGRGASRERHYQQPPNPAFKRTAYGRRLTLRDAVEKPQKKPISPVLALA
jgi:hypothetical protein